MQKKSDNVKEKKKMLPLTKADALSRLPQEEKNLSYESEDVDEILS